MGAFLSATNNAALAPLTNPKWVELTTLDTGADPATFTPTAGAPTATSDGTSLLDGIGCFVKADVRVLAKPPGRTNGAITPTPNDALDTSKRRAILNIDTFVASDEYTVSVRADGATVETVTTSSQPYASKAAAVAAIVAAITADDTPPGVGAIVTAEAVDGDGDGTVDSVLLTGVAEGDWALTAWNRGGGTGVVSGLIDAVSLGMDLYVSADGIAPVAPGWTRPPDGALIVGDYRGRIERLAVGGLDRLAVDVHTVGLLPDDLSTLTPCYRVWVAPGKLPGSQ